MREIRRNGKVMGFKIGEDISISTYTWDTQKWFLRIKKLRIEKVLCDKTCTRSTVVMHILKILINEQHIASTLIEEVGTMLIDQSQISNITP